MGLVWVGSPYLGPPPPTQCEGGQSVGVEGGELATSEELLLVVSPREEGMTGWVPFALCESALAPTSSV